MWCWMVAYPNPNRTSNPNPSGGGGRRVSKVIISFEIGMIRWRCVYMIRWIRKCVYIMIIGYSSKQALLVMFFDPWKKDRVLE